MGLKNWMNQRKIKKWSAAFWEMIEQTLPIGASAAELVERGIDAAWLEELIADHRLDPNATFAVYQRCRHVIAENERVLAGVTALGAGQGWQRGADAVVGSEGPQKRTFFWRGLGAAVTLVFG